MTFLVAQKIICIVNFEAFNWSHFHVVITDHPNENANKFIFMPPQRFNAIPISCYAIDTLNEITMFIYALQMSID